MSARSPDLQRSSTAQARPRRASGTPDAPAAGHAPKPRIDALDASIDSLHGGIEVLDAGIHALGLALDATQRTQLRDYLALLGKWNAHYNLTAIRDPAQMITHHALDALAVVPLLPAPDAHAPRTRMLDVGTGGGIPGIPLAIARPDIDVTLLDANGKKTAFVQQAIIELALPNAQVVTSRVETWQPTGDAPATFDVIISRAYSDLASFAQGASRHLAPQGRLYAMKGVMPKDEIAALPPGMRAMQTFSLEVPGLDAARSLVVMERA